MNIKQHLQDFFYPVNSIQTIKSGYLRKSKIIISNNTQWAPLFGRWEPAMQKIMVNIIKEGDVVYDLGANFGLHGMLCSKLVGSTGMLYNFEPLPENISEINKNYALNHISNYQNIQKAVSDKNQRLKFSVGHHATQGKLNNDTTNDGTIEVESITLDAFINQGNRLPNFIKMDIEGAEGEALKGFELNIEKSFLLMIIELHSPEADKKVGVFFKFYNYIAHRFNTFRSLVLEEIKNLSLPFPHPEGIWGSVLCVAPNMNIRDFRFNR
ncbi:MAG: FkbM family methyltransferase [Bacteroidetes bacterium]|nr:FkbM family methyltransferase [Bacteroidota bacterium]